MTGRLRFYSGLVLFVFVLGHFLNHALGIVSLEAMEAGLVVTVKPWRTLPGTIVISAALTTHVCLALWAVYQRRTLRMRAWEAAQLVLGLSIPFLLAAHVFATRGIWEAYGADGGYAFELFGLWVTFPVYGVLNGVGLVATWLHGCVGLHFWFRLKPWYAAAVPYLYAAALLIPALALAGYVSAGLRIVERGDDPAFVAALLQRLGTGFEVLIAYIFRYEEIVQFGLIALLVAIMAARRVRDAVLARLGRGRLHYRDPWCKGDRALGIERGASVLDALRGAGIPHASVCGGRGRCSTCRVRVGAGAEHLVPPSVEERRVLGRIGAPPNVRLACQILPTRNLEVTPLLPPTATARDGFARPGHLAGQEQEIAVLFADMRAFTRMSEAKLPYDVVFVLNRYFAALGQAVEAAGGRVDKFIGDGVMALFGVGGSLDDGCRRAVACARLMADNLAALNEALSGDLHLPLRIGIGIHAGQVVVGEMGYDRATYLTAIGDTVNIASRLEELTKEFDVQLVMSETVAAQSGVYLHRYPEREVTIRGRVEPLKVRIVDSALSLPTMGIAPPTRASATPAASAGRA
ncbi:MAG: adenylate/guanylate cyclase domain-containing protein [Rhodospirillaceae bacterium]